MEGSELLGLYILSIAEKAAGTVSKLEL